MRLAAAVSVLVLLCGCPDKPATTSSDAGANVAAIVDAGPPPPLPLDVRVQFDVPDAGIADVELELGRRATVPPAINIQLETNQPIRNYRVRLFDEVDKVVPSNDSAANEPERLHYVIGLEAPLKTGYRYALVFDAQTGAAMLDSEGRPISDLRYEFLVAGERQKPPPPPKKAPGKKKRK